MPFPWFCGFPFAIATCNSITTPLVYSEDMSIAQQIAHLFGLFQQQAETYLSVEEFNKFLDWLKTEEAALVAQVNDYTDSEIAKLRDLIEQLEGSALQFDVQHGFYTDTKTAQYDMFNDLAVHALTVFGLNETEYTVETLANSGMTVRGLAVWSGTYTNPDYIDAGIEA